MKIDNLHTEALATLVLNAGAKGGGEFGILLPLALESYQLGLQAGLVVAMNEIKAQVRALSEPKATPP